MQHIKINIAIIDSQQLFAEALADLLSSNDFVKEVKTFPSARKYLELHDTAMADIIIAQMNMIEMNGIDFLLEMKKLNSSARIIVLSSDVKANTIRFTINRGASGYLSNDTSSAELIAAILAVQHGDIYIGECLRKSLMQDRQPWEKNITSLSIREKEVLQYVCSGKTIKEAAIEMRLSVHTVQTYYKKILKKFNLNRTADLIVYAIKNRIYKPESNKFL